MTMISKLPKIGLIFLLATTTFASASDWHLGVEMAYARLSGVRAYDASKNFNEIVTKDMLVPTLKLSTNIGNKGETSLNYTFFDDIDSFGSSPDSDIFDESEVAFQVVSPYAISEEVQEFRVGYLYEIVTLKKARLKIGPNLSLFDSNANFYSKSIEGELGSDIYETVFRYLRSYSSSDMAFGVEANATVSLSDKIRVDCSYRFVNPTDRDIHMLSLGLGIKY